MSFELSSFRDAPAVFGGWEASQVFGSSDSRGAKRKLNQHIFEQGPGFHEVGLAAGNHRLKDGCSVAGRFAADEHPVHATNRHRTNGSSGSVIIDRQVAVFELAIQRGPLIERVRRRFAGQAFGRNTSPSIHVFRSFSSGHAACSRSD